ncbi:MAG: hypothetical protein MJ252_02475 [archaeon]|nr:hypothetical protein [archaeon]
MPDKNSYLLFSGVSHIRYSDVFIYDMSLNKWIRKNTTGEHPKELCYAVGWYDPPHFFFYGGRNKELTLSDVYFLNTDKWIWKKVFTVDQPLSRFYHAGCKIEGRIFYTFGGINIGRGNKILGDMNKYDYSKINIIYS